MPRSLDKPHILLLYNDEHRPDFLPVEGAYFLRTPTLDRLYHEGVNFRNAYTPAPICVPARQSYLSGLYPRNCGCTGFNDPMPRETRTLPGHLGHYGYYSACAGKMHFVGNHDVMHGWQERIGRDIVGNNGYPDDDIDASRAFQGQPQPGTGMKADKVCQEIRDAQPGIGHWMQHDAYTVDGALMFFNEYFVNASYDRPKQRPLLMAVSLWSPHYPYQCPADLFDYYMQRIDPIVEQPNDDFQCADFFRVRVGEDVTHRQAHRATAAYCGMIDWCDQQFARVIERLEALNVLDDFVIVFCSDHGEMLGSKGLWEKQQYFEPSARVPMAMWGPKWLGQSGITVTRNVSLVDIFPTLCDYADVPAPHTLDGRSLRPLIDGDDSAWPDTVFSELHIRQSGPSAMVKRGNLKYFRYDNDQGWPEQLFDLKADPDEKRNLRNDPAYTNQLAELRSLIDRLPAPRAKDAHNRYIDPHRPMPT